MTDFQAYKGTSLTFTTLIKHYKQLQSSLLQQVRALQSSLCATNPGQFILLQFQMQQVVQVGESISNMIAQVNSVIKSSISNQRQ
jgi:hypothetical protein